jgi:hypothetical protein
MSDAIKFDRKPYTISYTDSEGNLKKIRRVPPPKLHNALPTDKVELTRKHSDQFRAGEEVTVKSINPRHPNTLKVENADGETTFINHYEMFLKEKITRNTPASSAESSDEEIPSDRNKYLLWP